MIIVDKVKKLCQIVDFAIPYDTRVNTKESEKIDKYQDPVRESKKIWNMKVVIIPVIIGTLGTTPKNICKRMDEIGIKIRTSELLKTTIIHTARTLRKVLEIWGVLLTLNLQNYNTVENMINVKTKIIITISSFNQTQLNKRQEHRQVQQQKASVYCLVY